MSDEPYDWTENDYEAFGISPNIEPYELPPVFGAYAPLSGYKEALKNPQYLDPAKIHPMVEERIEKMLDEGFRALEAHLAQH